jgi:two-component system sensor histidine kinase/response regulator
VDIADNGLRALEKLAVGSYDAVLMDCQMPELDGYETTRRIRAGDVPGLNPRIPIIALTAYAMTGDRTRCLEAGMDDYITKPLNREDLQEAFARCGLTAAKKAGPADSAAASPLLSEPVLDYGHFDQLKAIAGSDGRTLAAEVVELFLREMPGRMSALNEHVAQRRELETSRLAHTISGSCASIGAKALRVLAQMLENAAREQAWNDIPRRYAAVKTGWEQLQQELTKPNLLQ